MNTKPNPDPLHGVTLAMMLEVLVKHYGWGELGKRINIRCFNMNPSIKSSLTFLRKTTWAREKVETLYFCHVTAKENTEGNRRPPVRSVQPGPVARPAARRRDNFEIRREF